MRRLLLSPALVRGAQILLGVLFGWAALAKLGNVEAFALQVHNFRLLPAAAEHLVAIVLPWIELVAALSLVLGIRPRSGAIVAATLMALFTIAVAAAMARGLDFECGCFGTSDATRVGTGKLLQNLGMTALGVVAALRPTGPLPAALGGSVIEVGQERA